MAEFGQTMEEITLLRNGTNEFDSYHTTYISCERLWLASLSYNFLIHGHSDYCMEEVNEKVATSILTAVTAGHGE